MIAGAGGDDTLRGNNGNDQLRAMPAKTLLCRTRRALKRSWGWRGPQ